MMKKVNEFSWKGNTSNTSMTKHYHTINHLNHLSNDGLLLLLKGYNDV